MKLTLKTVPVAQHPKTLADVDPYVLCESEDEPGTLIFRTDVVGPDDIVPKVIGIAAPAALFRVRVGLDSLYKENKIGLPFVVMTRGEDGAANRFTTPAEEKISHVVGKLEAFFGDTLPSNRERWPLLAKLWDEGGRKAIINAYRKTGSVYWDYNENYIFPEENEKYTLDQLRFLIEWQEYRTAGSPDLSN